MDSVCWAFETIPSKLRDLYADVSYNDIKTKIRLKTGEKLATAENIYESFVIVVNRALGGKNSTPPVADPSTAPKTFEEFEATMTRVLG